MKKTKLSPSLAVLLAAPLVLALAWPTARLVAQTQTEAKIRLMADALRARDSGELETAQKNLEELLAIAPNDSTVQRLLAGVNAALAARGAGTPVPAEATPVPAAPTADEPVEVTFPKPEKPRTSPSEKTTPVADVAVAAPISAPAVSVRQEEDEADAIAKAEERRVKGLVETAKDQRKAARSLAKSGRYDEAGAALDAAAKALPANPATQSLLAELQKERDSLLLDKAQFLLKRGDTEGARAALDAYAQLAPGSSKAEAVARKLERVESDPPLQPIELVNPKFIAEQKQIAQLSAKGRSQYLAGDTDGAQETFRALEAADPDNPEAKNFLSRIANEKAEIGALNREKTRAQMVEEVAKSWQRPGIYQERGRATLNDDGKDTALAQKLATIQIPSVSFNNVEIGKVVKTLSDISEEFDASSGPIKGVNIVLIDPSNKNPGVSITLRNLSLKRVLDFIVDTVGYQYEVQADAIVVRPGGETSTLDTAFFPITRSTAIRMTGIGGEAAAPAAVADPFAAAPMASPAGGSGGASGEAQALRGFLQQAGVNFDGVQGSSLAYDGSAMIVTQTTRNIDRIRNILNRYNDVRQVEIEAKFIEVQQGDLEELGVQWNVSRRGVPQFDPTTGAPVLNSSGAQVFTPRETYSTVGNNRSLNSAFTGATASNSLSVTGLAGNLTIPLSAPALPGSAQLGGTSALASITGMVGEFDVNAVVRALSQKQGSDLLSAPKVTVLSGNPANITVAQEFRYPQSYGEIRSQVSGGSVSANTNGLVGGSSSVTITAGTPQEFTSRNVGVELKVTPTVEEDDYSISLDLNPKVTEFEGFVEYGGTSIAISGGTTVSVPSGFYQPIFAVREVTTKVTVWDGATLVMGGLTREEVKKVDDKVPILGDIPIIGRAFRSKGETSQKRNLLIFVTANLVSPGGSPKKQQLKSTQPSSMFQNPTIVTPASSESRVRSK